MKCQEMTVNFDKAGKVDTIISKGDVQVVQPGRVTHCGQAIYYHDQDMFDLTDQPVIVDNNKKIAAPEIIIYRNKQSLYTKGKSTVVPAPGQLAQHAPQHGAKVAGMKHRLPKAKPVRRKPTSEQPEFLEGDSLLLDPPPSAETDAPEVLETEGASVLREPVPASVQPPPLLAHPHSAPLAHEEVALGEALIQTHGLVKQYGGRRVVNGVDIHVRAGEVVGLLGKNGAGKTTTFYMIVGLVPPTEGHVFMGEEDVTRMPMYRRARRGIGYLPQEESIFRKLSVEENLLAILETLPMSEEDRDRRCDDLLRDFGLEHVRENIAITLSGGEKRRVTIARALVTQPNLLLLDEPFSGVDPMAVHDIQEIILHLKQRGLGVLITDHNVRETLSVVDRAYIIDEGRVLSEGTRDFLLNDPVAREIYLGHRFTM